jgi:general secretion pathway protein K
LISRLKNQKGIALILAMFTIVIVSYLATEIAYETNVEYLVNAAAVQHVKAYYAARAGIELSLLRIKIYNQVTSQIPAHDSGRCNSTR